MKTIIHINQHVIKANKKRDSYREPVITVKTYKSTTYTHGVAIVGDDGNIIARIIYSPDKPLSCGAHVWIEADDKNVKCLDKVGEPYEPIPS